MNMDKLNIAFIGFNSPNGMATRLGEDLVKRGHNIYFIDTLTYAMNYCTRRLNQKEYIPLDAFLKGKLLTLKELGVEFPGVDFDVIFIEQANLRFENDYENKETVVIYYHRDLPGTFNCVIPDLLLFRFESAKLFLEVYHRYEWYNSIYKTRFLNGIYPPLYNPKAKKKFKDLVWIGLYRPMEYYMNKDVIQHDYYIHTKLIKDWAKEKGIIMVFESNSKVIPPNYTYEDCDRIPFPLYKHILERSEGILIIPGRNAYVTRKCYEAAVCRTVIVLWVQNERARKVYEEWGLVDCLNCYLFNSKEDLELISEMIRSEDLVDVAVREGIKDNAYKWVMENHTYKIRATRLLALIAKVITYKKRREEELVFKNK
jgi:hypothetical protein